LIADFAAPTGELGSYIAEEISTLLVNGKHLTVVERSAAVMQTLSAETAYQLSGEVDDHSIQSIGQKTGAEYIITGSISGSADQYRLRLKITSVLTSEVRGQWSAEILRDKALTSLLARQNPEPEAPEWVSMPYAARSKYEQGSPAGQGSPAMQGGQGVSIYYYDVGLSNRATTRQTAQTRARQNVQQMVAANIASQIAARIDVTDFSEGAVSDSEEIQRRVDAAITQSIRTRVPSYEPLEFYIETGKENNRDWYIANILVRFARRDILATIEQVETDRMVENILKELDIREARAREQARQELIGKIKDILVITENEIRDGVTGN
jgi:TolB-like protein